MSTKFWTDEKVAQLQALYAKGYGPTRIARVMQTSRERVLEGLGRHTDHQGPPRWTEHKRRRLNQLVLAGKSRDEVMSLMGINLRAYQYALMHYLRIPTSWVQFTELMDITDHYTLVRHVNRRHIQTWVVNTRRYMHASDAEVVRAHYAAQVDPADYPHWLSSVQLAGKFGVRRDTVRMWRAQETSPLTGIPVRLGPGGRYLYDPVVTDQKVAAYKGGVMPANAVDIGVACAALGLKARALQALLERGCPHYKLGSGYRRVVLSEVRAWAATHAPRVTLAPESTPLPEPLSRAM